jgi:multicomponent Na+:H+ antiporter subunit A
MADASRLHGVAAYGPAFFSGLLAFAAMALAVDGIPEGGLSLAVAWLPAFGIEAAFRLDGLSLAFTLLIAGVGALVLLYTAAYARKDHRRGRLLWLLVAFEISMLGLVLADDALTLFLFWEGTTITSYLLVGFDHHKAEARAKALQALMVTGAGGLALMAGLILMGHEVGSYRLSDALAAGDALRASPLYLPVVALVLAGCFTKSAQVPFHFWLPNAMAAPTPVSAYLHSATMVKAGVYLIARLSPALAGTPVWIWTLTLVGGATMLLGAVWALRQTDMKSMLAYTTVSGLGSLVMFLGSNVPVAVVAASTFLIVHAFYKAALFLIIGIIDKQTGTREIDALGGLGRALPVTWAVALLAGFAMAGFPPLLGFIGKELKYEGALAVASEPLFVAGVAVLSNALMVAIGLAIAFRPFTGARRAAKAEVHEAPWPMLAGPLTLAVLGLVFGVVPEAVETHLVQPMATAILGGPVRVDLKLWHGLNIPLILSMTTFLLGVLAFWLLPWLRNALAGAEPRLPRMERGYEAWLAGLKALAARTAAALQTGRLSDYLRLTFGALAAMLMTAALMGHGKGGVGMPPLTLVEIGVLLLVAAGALALPGARSRLQAVGALSVVGSGVALIFALYGAVDVAMTQLLVETLLIVIIAVALLRLPSLGPVPQGPSRAFALPIAVGVGAGLTLAMLAVLATPFDPTVSDWFAQAAWPEAYGRNIVNVILVDFRALDTFGEIVVVAVAGLAALALLQRRAGDAG